jgi:hypothetical protein
LLVGTNTHFTVSRAELMIPQTSIQNTSHTFLWQHRCIDRTQPARQVQASSQTRNRRQAVMETINFMDSVPMTEKSRSNLYFRLSARSTLSTIEEDDAKESKGKVQEHAEKTSISRAHYLG